MIGLYNNERFNAFNKENKIRLSRRGKLEGFSLREVSGEIYSYILINKKELQELYDINFYVRWKGMQFQCGCDWEKQVILLWFGNNNKNPKELGFIEEERGCFYKEVPIDDCSDFTYEKIDYLNDHQIAKFMVTKEEFIDVYKKNRDELR